MLTVVTCALVGSTQAEHDASSSHTKDGVFRKKANRPSLGSFSLGRDAQDLELRAREAANEPIFFWSRFFFFLGTRDTHTTSAVEMS